MKKHALLLVMLFAGICCLGAQFSLDSLRNAAKKAAEKAGVDSGTVEKVTKVADATIKGVATYTEAKKAADSLTPENEYYLGRAVAANIAGTYTMYRNAALQTYLDKICDTIVINSPRPEIYNGYHAAILDTDEINAFATPGGHIFVTRGLIACAANEDALAAVIAHEIAHIQKQHALTAIRNARYANAAISGALAGLNAADAGGNITELADIMGDSVNEVVTTLMVNGFSQDQEFEADETALALLASAGYQPSALLEMLRVLKEKQRGSAGFGKTHPSPDARIAGVNKTIGKYKVPDTRSFRAARYISR